MYTKGTQNGESRTGEVGTQIELFPSRLIPSWDLKITCQAKLPPAPLQFVSSQSVSEQPRNHEVHSLVYLWQTQFCFLWCHKERWYITQASDDYWVCCLTSSLSREIHWIYLHLERGLPNQPTNQPTNIHKVDWKSVCSNILKTVHPNSLVWGEPFTLWGHRKTSQMEVFQSGFGEVRLEMVPYYPQPRSYCVLWTVHSLFSDKLIILNSLSAVGVFSSILGFAYTFQPLFADSDFQTNYLPLSSACLCRP